MELPEEGSRFVILWTKEHLGDGGCAPLADLLSSPSLILVGVTSFVGVADRSYIVGRALASRS